MIEETVDSFTITTMTAGVDSLNNTKLTLFFNSDVKEILTSTYHKTVLRYFTIQKGWLANLMNHVWSFQFYNFMQLPVADPGFPRGGANSQVGVLTYYLAKFLKKTAWKWKNLGREYGASPLPPGSANGYFAIPRENSVQFLPNILSNIRVTHRSINVYVMFMTYFDCRY